MDAAFAAAVRADWSRKPALDPARVRACLDACEVIATRGLEQIARIERNTRHIDEQASAVVYAWATGAIESADPCELGGEAGGA